MQNRNQRAFLIYLSGQGVSYLGESFRFIAVTMLIFKLTGSGLSAAWGLVLSALPSILASPFAGVLGDRTDEKRVLVLTDLARFLTAPLFLYVNHIMQIYLLLILFSLIDVIYGPSKRKFVLALTGKDGALKANSLLTGVSGAAYLTGPMAAGYLTDIYGSAPAILFASGCCIVSSLVTLITGIIMEKPPSLEKVRRKVLRWNSALMDGIRYCFSTQPVHAVLITGLITGFCTISVNLAFYPYAFDILRVTAKGWSLMITIYYGTNLVAMLLVKYLRNYIRTHAGRLFYIGLAIISVLWGLYAGITEYAAVLFLQFVEGTTIALCGILLVSRLQVVADGRAIARVSGINDIFSSIGRLGGLGCSILLSTYFKCGAVFVFNGAILFLFALTGLIGSAWAGEGKER